MSAPLMPEDMRERVMGIIEESLTGVAPKIARTVAARLGFDPNDSDAGQEVIMAIGTAFVNQAIALWLFAALDTRGISDLLRRQSEEVAGWKSLEGEVDDRTLAEFWRTITAAA